jgi:hypothetical protein
MAPSDVMLAACTAGHQDNDNQFLLCAPVDPAESLSHQEFG